MAIPEDMFFDRPTMAKQDDDGIDELMIEPLVCDSQHCDAGMNMAKASEPQDE